MASNKHYRKVRIFVASPTDVTQERDRLLAVVNEFNRSGSLVESYGLIVEALDWRTHVAPFMGRPEEVTLQQMPVETWDIFLGILWLGFGTPTGGIDPKTNIANDSGTEVEFKMAYRLWQSTGRPAIMFYRYTRPPERLDDLNPLQFGKIKLFLEAFGPEGEHPGFVQEFNDANEFQFHWIKFM